MAVRLHSVAAIGFVCHFVADTTLGVVQGQESGWFRLRAATDLQMRVLIIEDERKVAEANHLTMAELNVPVVTASSRA